MTDPQQPGPLRFGFLGFFATLSVLSLALNVYLWSSLDRETGGNASAGPVAPPVTAADHVRGPTDAPVTVIVYSDFECAFCRELHASLRHLAATESFRWTMRHVPLPNHANAERYAEACECAGRQGRFWEFADWLFEALTPRPAAPAGPVPPGAALPLDRPEPLTPDALVAAAARLGVGTDAFRGCLERADPRARIDAHKAEAESLAITATPTFFVGGTRVVGAVTIDELRQLIKGRPL